MLSICFNDCVKLSKHKKDPQRIAKIEPFIDLYNWKKKHFSSQGNDWEKFESKNKLIDLNILYVPHNTKK